MRLIKFTHACVRLEDGDRRLLIDPGIWTEREAYEGVTDILVTSPMNTTTTSTSSGSRRC